VRAVSGVVAVSPYISGKGSVGSDGAQEGVMITGIDDSLEPLVTNLKEKMTDGRLSLDSAESSRGKRLPGILLGTGLAEKLGARPGSEVILSTVVATDENVDLMSSVRMAQLVVTGIFETGLYEYDLSLVYISIPSAQRLFGMNGIEGFQIRTVDLFRADKIGEQVRRALGGYPYRVIDWQAQNRSLFKWMKLERLIIFLVILLIIVVAAFNIVSSLLMMILEKRREIGILMGMGATSGKIMRVFMINGTVVGLVGSTLGVSLACAACFVQMRWALIPLPGDIYFINKVPVLLKTVDICAIFVSANLVCFLATLYPAWLASKILPAESLRLE
jgi:lipoprotein-releasing system permease protein